MVGDRVGLKNVFGQIIKCGRITERNNPNHYTVQYDDGTNDTWKSEKEIRHEKSIFEMF